MSVRRQQAAQQQAENNEAPPAEKPPDDSNISGSPEDSPLAAPTEQTPSTPAEPQYREVTINGRKFQADPELYEAITQRDRDFDRKLNASTQELGNLRKFYNEH